MDITKSLIINNFEWILAQQTTADILKMSNLHQSLLYCLNTLKELDIPDIHTNPDEYLPTSHQNHHVYPLYKFFIELNNIQSNRLTYLSNIVGIFLIMSLTDVRNLK